jgi:transcriptional regulator with XRE-family HTH domain
MHYTTHMLRHLRALIGHNIHRMRVERKLPLQKLSRACGVAEERIDRYELGKNEIGLDDLLKIACVLDVRVSELLD